MNSLSIAYMFTCLGFCLGFVVCSIFRSAAPTANNNAARSAGPEAPRVQRANRRAADPGLCACGYLRCVCPTGTPR